MRLLRQRLLATSTAPSSWPSAGDDELLEWAGLAALDATDAGEQLGMLLDVDAERRRAVVRGADGRVSTGGAVFWPALVRVLANALPVTHGVAAVPFLLSGALAGQVLASAGWRHSLARAASPPRS
jgi:hypothetical protein